MCLDCDLEKQKGEMSMNRFLKIVLAVAVVAGTAAVTSVRMTEGVITVRGYETAGKAGEARVRVSAPPREARVTDLAESGVSGEARVEGNEVIIPMRGFGIWNVEIGF